MNLFHYDTLSKFKAKIYGELLSERHLSKSTPKLIEFRNPVQGMTEMQAYTLVRGNTMYLLRKEDLSLLPIRIVNQIEAETKNNDIVQIIQKPKSFNVRALKDMTLKQLVHIEGFTHTCPEDWTLWKIFCWASMVAKINARVSGPKEWGKNSYFNILSYLLNNAYIVMPKSVPGIAQGFSPDGVLILDEMGGVRSDIIETIQSIIYQAAAQDYITIGTAGSLAYNTKPKYDTPFMSLICTFNDIQYYKDPKHFFDYMFPNPEAINDRYLPLKLPSGALSMDQFVQKKGQLTDEDCEQFYKIMRSYRWYQDAWKAATLSCFTQQQQFTELMDKEFPLIKGRQMFSFRTTLMFIWEYAEGDSTVFSSLALRLYGWYKAYMFMIRETMEFGNHQYVTEETIQ